MLVITGGVSVGERDFVKAAIEALGGEFIFWKVNMKPGKPVAFAMIQGKPVFALPGNPVAAMVSFRTVRAASHPQGNGTEANFQATSNCTTTGTGGQ